MLLAWRFMSGIIRRVGIKMDVNGFYLQALEKRSCCEQQPATPSLFGESFETIALMSEQVPGKPESTVQYLETNPASTHPTLYARRAQSLLIAGLIAGITPMSIRKRLGADCREVVFLPLDGDTSGFADTESEPEAVN